MDNWYSILQLFLGGFGVLFLALILIAVVALIFLVVLKKGKRKNKELSLNLKSLNDKFTFQKEGIQSIIYNENTLKVLKKEQEEKEKIEEKEEKKSLKKEKGVTFAALEEEAKARVFVIEFSGDVAASQVDSLREQVTCVLDVARAKDEVVVKLESPGGMVHSYGLASSQLQRIRARSIPLTVCVDKIAASGGYMMACIAQKIVAAPFAILGSIGVVAALPNFNRVLRKFDVDYLELTAGEYKRTISPLGEITEKGKAKFLEQLEDTHVLFKQFVVENRPCVDLAQVATGEHWYGLRAKNLGLIDEIATSDDYIKAKCETADVYLVEVERKESMKEKLAQLMHASVSKLLAFGLARASSYER